MGIQVSPVLLIDGEVVLVDKYPNQKELETIIQEKFRDFSLFKGEVTI
jgi:hypothetical protein